MSSNLLYFSYVVVLLIFFHINGTYSSNLNSVLERLKYLEIRINSESKFRDEDFLKILERLDKIDRILNKTLETRTNTEENDKTHTSEYFDIMENVNDGYSRIRKAFKEEKYENERIRRQIPNLENNITSIQQDLQKYCSTSLAKTEKIHLHVTDAAESVKSEILKNIEKAKSSLQETVHESALQVGNHSDISRENENMKLLITSLTNKVDDIFTLLLPESCLGVRNIGKIQNGVYKLRNQMEVYCDQKTDGGGWTVFQRRINGAVDFYKSWDEYKAGFGDLHGEFWLGNEILSTLTTSNYDYELRVDMEDFEGNKAFAKYSKFRIHTEDDLYRLEVSGYSGNAGDSLTYHNGMPFTTYDRDNDQHPSINCAKDRLGAWWYNSCHSSNLNGKYYNEAGKISNKGIDWFSWKSKSYSLKTVELKFR